jgi:serine/threonine-protein kinase
MKLAAEQWLLLSQLLDDALALPEAERASWVATLGPEHASLKSLLADLFARPASVATTDLIGTLPSFAVAPGGDDWAVNAIVGPYRLIREVGRGGMGAVWLAERADGLVRRQVAVKLPILAAPRKTLAERFAREWEILAPLVHPHIARLYDAGFAADGQPYLALEFVAGEPITAYCDQRHLSVRKRIELFLQVLAAVQYAHANLVLHRDLKPSNILVTSEGEIKLLDFGIAKLMADGAAQQTVLTQLAGGALTPDYAAPEQISGAPLTTASDVYSLGVVLYELLAGTRPYRLKRQTRAEIEEAILAQEVLRPSAAISGVVVASNRMATVSRLKRQVAGDLDTIVLKSLGKDPSQRYATAEAFAQDLQRHLRGEPVQARPASSWYHLGKFISRNKVALSAGGIAAAVLIASTSLALWQSHIARLEAARAHASKAFVDQLFENVARGNPGGAAAGDTTARQMLELGSRQLLNAPAADPELQLELMQWFAHLNSDLDLLEPASTLAESSIGLATKLHGARSLQVASALAQKADNLYRAGNYGEATGVAKEALAIAEEQPRTTLELRAKMHIIIGNSAYQLDSLKTEESQRHLEVALALLRQANSHTEDRSRAAYYLAWVKQVQHDYAAAESYIQDGIDAGRENFGEKSFIVAFGYESLANNLRRQQRLDAASEAIGKALLIYQFVLGPRHGTVAFAQTTFALIEAARGHYSEAERVADQALALARDVFGENARQTGFPASYASHIKADRGELATAAEGYERAIAIFDRTEPQSALTARLLRVELAHSLIAMDQLGRAGTVLAGADAGFIAAQDTTSVYAVRATLAHAELACAQGDARAGQVQLDRALVQIDALGKSAPAALPRFAETAVRCQRGPEQAQAALDRLKASGLLPSSPDNLRIDIADKASLVVAIGRLYLGVGQRDLAREWLSQGVALREDIDVPDSIWLAQAKNALAAAVSATGKEAQAPAFLARTEVNHGRTLSSTVTSRSANEH